MRTRNRVRVAVCPGVGLAGWEAAWPPLRWCWGQGACAGSAFLPDPLLSLWALQKGQLDFLVSLYLLVHNSIQLLLHAAVFRPIQFLCILLLEKRCVQMQTLSQVPACLSLMQEADNISSWWKGCSHTRGMEKAPTAAKLATDASDNGTGLSSSIDLFLFFNNSFIELWCTEPTIRLHRLYNSMSPGIFCNHNHNQIYIFNPTPPKINPGPLK